MLRSRAGCDKFTRLKNSHRGIARHGIVPPVQAAFPSDPLLLDDGSCDHRAGHLALCIPAAGPAIVPAPPTDDLRCLAHDLKNKLQVVTGFCDLLPLALSRPDEASREKALGFVAHIRAAAEQSVRIADGIIQPRAGTAAALVDLNALLIEEVGPLVPELLRERINVHVEQGVRVPAVRVDPLGLSRAVINLAKNARDAIRTQGHRINSGRITFSTSLPAIASPVPYVVLAVADNGPGMDEETTARIWEPGWSTKDHGSGLRGYGLASVHAFVTQAGGLVEVHSEPGHGATFSLCLPAAP